MPFINNHQAPSKSLLESIDRKINVAGSEPRVIIEFDKMVYVPGIKFRYETLEHIYNSSITAIATVDTSGGVNGGESQTGGGTAGSTGDSPMVSEMSKIGEPTTYNASNPTSGDRFEYIKCMMMTYLTDACLPTVYYPFMLAVAWHETGFGTLGQGRPQNGSFIVGYGCPGSCDMTYKSIKTQARMFAKRIKEALKNRHTTIANRGYMTADDINYFHQGGDKGYNNWVWSADGANWKKRVGDLYSQIRSEMGTGTVQPLANTQNKWRCSKQGSKITTLNFTNSACSNYYQSLVLNSSVTQSNSEVIEGEYEEVENSLYDILRPDENETDVYYVNGDEVIDVPRQEGDEIEDLVPYNYEITQGMSSTSTSQQITFPLANKSYSNSVLTSKYYTENKKRPTHYGVDLVPARGKCNGWTIIAAWDGVVDKAGWGGGAGYYVRIKHYNGFATHYFHMQKGSLLVHAGQTVKAGTPLGKCGNTGDSDGAHLHFEILKAGANPWAKASKINPRPYLEGSAKASVNVPTTTGTGGGATLPTEPKIVTGEVIKNKVFDFCMSSKLKTLPSKYFTDKGSGEFYTKFDTKTAEDVNIYGFKPGSIAENKVDSITCIHKFSADGLFEAKLYVNLQASDHAYIRVDGRTYASFTSADNGIVSIAPIYMSFINTAGSSEVETVATEANEHVIDLYVQDNSGKAEIGYMCVTMSELEGGAVSQSAKYRTKVDWIEQGDVVFEKTITLEDDIKSWEVVNHFDTDSSTARITLDNSTRIYSPTYVYGDIAFPANKYDSEFTYFEEGELRHIISEGTPVRIYAGYGDDLVRVFTGTITGEVEDDADNNVVTFECVDMFANVENHIFMTNVSYPEVATHEEIANGISNKVNESWVMSSIVHNIANRAGLSGWRIVEDDLMYPDIVIQETYYIDIDKGSKVATVWDAKAKRYVKKTINTVKTLEGYKNPYVMSIDFEQGTRASDAIHQLIGDTMFKAYCDRYGTFKLEHLIRMYESDPKWEFVDTVNLSSLNTSVDYTRTRNHLMILGNQGQTEHFVDKELIKANRGKVKTAQVEVDWIDESYGASAYGEKKAVADRLFLDMKRQSRTFNVEVKGNPLIDVLDGCYIYSQDSSVQGYYLVKGHTLRGDAENMRSSLELTWGINGYQGNV